MAMRVGAGVEPAPQTGAEVPSAPGRAAQDPRLARKQARLAEILDAAWDIAREQGLGAVTLHEVARRVGLRQPSLYAYFDSKAGLYDLLYAQGYTVLLERLESAALPPEPRPALVEMSRMVIDFQVSEPAKGQLLFLRTVPGFEPSAPSYALAQRFLDLFTTRLKAAGARSDGHVDVFTALIAGIAGQQAANDPGGDRWTRHLVTVLDLYFSLLDGDAAAGAAGPTARPAKRRPQGGARPRSEPGRGRS